jgi:hypothetical protein
MTGTSPLESTASRDGTYQPLRGKGMSATLRPSFQPLYLLTPSLKKP